MNMRYPRFDLKRFAWMSLALALVLTGCSGNPYQKSRVYTLPQIHAPHLQWLSAVSRIPQPDGTKGGVIWNVTPFQRPGTSTPQLIVNEGSSLYLVNVDGSGLHQLNMGGDCGRSVTVTADSQWIACEENRAAGDGSDRLLVAALHPNGVSQAREVRLSDLPFYYDLAWSPDGRYLATQLSDTDGTVNVTIFSSPPPHTSFTPAVTLNSDLFTTEFCCDGDSIVWASNSQLLLVHPQGSKTTMAQVSIANALLTFNSTQPASPVSQFVSSQQFKPIYNGPAAVLLPPLGPGKPPFDPRRSSLILQSGEPMTLSELDLGTGHAVTLLTITSNLNLIVGWMPNGRELYIVTEGKQCVDCGAYIISDVYLYSIAASP